MFKIILRNHFFIWQTHNFTHFINRDMPNVVDHNLAAIRFPIWPEIYDFFVIGY